MSGHVDLELEEFDKANLFLAAQEICNIQLELLEPVGRGNNSLRTEEFFDSKFKEDSNGVSPSRSWKKASHF